MQTFDAIGFGALNFDRLYTVNKLAKRGEHQPIQEIQESPGGSAANTIAGLADLGMRTGFIGAVGGDSEGETIIRDFKLRGVDTKGIAVLGGRTGEIIGFVDSEGERTLYVYPGVNNIIEYSERQLEYAKKAKLLHLSSFVSENQLRVQEKIVKELPNRVKVSFSPGILYSKLGLNRLLPILRRSHIVFLNEHETKVMTDMGYKEGSMRLIEEGVDIVAVTLGKRGCFVRDSENAVRLNAEKVKAVDSTGAGDAFAAGFIYSILKKKDIVEAAETGNKIASKCVSVIGARAHLQRI